MNATLIDFLRFKSGPTSFGLVDAKWGSTVVLYDCSWYQDGNIIRFVELPVRHYILLGVRQVGNKQAQQHLDSLINNLEAVL